jgi:hypothetical protein
MLAAGGSLHFGSEMLASQPRLSATQPAMDITKVGIESITVAYIQTFQSLYSKETLPFPNR